MKYRSAHHSATYTNGKVVIAYQDTDNSNRGTAIVGTVSGTSIRDLQLYLNLLLSILFQQYMTLLMIK